MEPDRRMVYEKDPKTFYGLTALCVMVLGLFVAGIPRAGHWWGLAKNVLWIVFLFWFYVREYRRFFFLSPAGDQGP